MTIGQRVAIPWLGYACGTCDYCVSGWETLCHEQKNTGYSIDGSFGQFATAYGRYVVVVPDGIDPIDAAPLTCAGVTTYKAIKVAGTRSSDLVAVFGVGGLGHLAIQYARIAGGRVVAVDLHDDKLQLARELGAEFTVNATEQDPAEAIQALGGADQAIALAVSPTRVRAGLRFAAPRWDARVRRAAGRQRGPAPDLRDRAQRDHRGRLDRRHPQGSARGVRAARRRPDRVISETRPLDHVNEAIADVEAGRVAARVVLQP